jgi:hypothetical protein
MAPTCPDEKYDDTAATPIVDCPPHHLTTELQPSEPPMASTCPDEKYDDTAATPIVECPPHHLTTELQPPEPTSIPFAMLSPLVFLPRKQSVVVVTTASPYRSPSPPPSCECCRILLGMKVAKGPKIMC